MELEAVTEGDVEGLRDLQPPGWPDIVPVFRYYLRMPFCTPVKAVRDRRTAGVGVAISLGRTAWLAHIIVAQDFRTRGIGSCIVGRLLERLGAAGCDTVSLIATELGFPVYRKAGFVEQEEYLFFEREEPLRGVVPSENIARPAPEDTEALLALDRRISGEERRAVLAGDMEGSRVYRSGGRITGLYMPELAEGPVFADDAEAGIELMRLRCSAACRAALPAGNGEGVAFLKEHGFSERKRATRMVRGKGFPWRPEGIFGRISGNLG